ncbi:MAG: Uma2 family endonuclease [Gammaproteobacteria bacterium]
MKTSAVTSDELLRMPNDGHRYELLDGELRKMAPAGQKHGRIIINITTPLDQYVRANQLGAVYAAETGFQLTRNPDTVRAPDVAFVSSERLAKLGEVEGYWPGAPDLAVEVISPSDSYADVEDKVFDWRTAGTRLVIVVNPRKRAVMLYKSLSEISVLTEGDTIDANDVVPGWKLPVRNVFE